VPGASADLHDSVAALLSQACPDPSPPTRLPAADTVAGWYQQTRAGGQSDLAEAREQLAALRREVRRRIIQAVVWICRSFLVTPLVLPRALPDQRVQNSFGSASTCDAAHSK
jgi:hypothetical protein